LLRVVTVEVDFAPGGGALHQHDLNRENHPGATVEDRAQDLVASYDAPQGILQDVGAQLAFEQDSDAGRIGCTAAVLQRPEPLLLWRKAIALDFSLHFF